MSEVDRQRKRIDNIVVTTGRAPNILDVEPAAWSALINEIRGDVRFRGCYIAGPSPWNISETSKEPEDAKHIELFGVRFCKGRV